MEKTPVASGLRFPARRVFSFRSACVVASSVIALALAACSGGPRSAGVPTKVEPGVQILNPGDVVKIAFPSSPTLDTTQQIRRDGRLNLYLIGEVKAADKTPADLERDLLKAYSEQTRADEIKVTVVSSSFSVFVTGAVMKPGKIVSERPLTAFDAIMEAGGFDQTKSDMKHVRVIRQEDGQVKTYPVNMKAVLDGAEKEPFYLKTYDTVYVPEKFSWF